MKKRESNGIPGSRNLECLKKDEWNKNHCKSRGGREYPRERDEIEKKLSFIQKRLHQSRYIDPFKYRQLTNQWKWLALELEDRKYADENIHVESLPFQEKYSRHDQKYPSDPGRPTKYSSSSWEF